MSDYPGGIPVDVSVLFEKLALDLWEVGFDRYSARAILHRIRWHHHVDIGDRSFKANNNWTPVLARWLMDKYPTMEGFFKTRSSPHAGVLNPDHNMDDYEGPFQ